MHSEWHDGLLIANGLFWSSNDFSHSYYFFILQKPAKDSLVNFLNRHGRERVSSLGDGNCLFRSLSYNLFHTQEYHYELRALLIRFENLNQAKFKGHLKSKLTVLEHVMKLSVSNSWGTDLEILAAASYYQIPAFYCCKNNITREWVWNRIDPVAPSSQLRYPLIVDNTFPIESKPTHFELVYWTNTHYDGIVSKITSRVHTEIPEINVTHDYVFNKVIL